MQVLKVIGGIFVILFVAFCLLGLWVKSAWTPYYKEVDVSSYKRVDLWGVSQEDGLELLRGSRHMARDGTGFYEYKASEDMLNLMMNNIRNGTIEEASLKYEVLDMVGQPLAWYQNYSDLYEEVEWWVSKKDKILKSYQVKAPIHGPPFHLVHLLEGDRLLVCVVSM